MNINVGGILDMSTVDYPGKVSSVVFLCGCNFRCPFCYNFKLVFGEGCKEVDTAYIINKIKKYSEFLDAVVITGGEPSLQSDALKELCKKIKDELKLLVKIDTNATNPECVKQLVEGGLLDFVSMDLKASPEKYKKLSGVDANISKIKETLEFLKNSNIDYEIRTTIVPGLNDSTEDIKKMCEFLGKVKVWILQQFVSEHGTLDKSLSNVKNTKREALLKLAEVAKNCAKKVKIRTEEEGEEEV